VTVPALEPDPNRPATISHKVITDLLINDMHFGGMVVTDALDMKALTGVFHGTESQAAGRAAVEAFKAGNDLMLMPSDLDGAYNGLLNAAKSGEITQPELDLRVMKVLRAKAALGLHRGRLVDLDKVAEVVGRPEDVALAQQVADSAITLAKDEGTALQTLQAERQRRKGTSAVRSPYDMPEEAGQGVFALIVNDDMRSESGRIFERELRARIPDANIMFVDSRVAAQMTESAADAATKARAVIIAAYAIPSAGRRVVVQGVSKGSAGLAGDAGALVDKVLQSAGKKAVMIAMGNPYLANDFPAVPSYICTFSNAPTSETAAVKALFGEIPIGGKLPVTLPNIAQRGTGIERPATTARKRPESSGTLRSSRH
jgi:beta-N-acetylhexosaminidase